MALNNGGYIYEEHSDSSINFIDSEVGLVLKTCEVTDSGVTADENRYKTIKAGTVYPADDATAIGIITENVDVTHGSKTASVMVAGRVLTDRIEISDEAKAALTDIIFVTVPETER